MEPTSEHTIVDTLRADTGDRDTTEVDSGFDDPTAEGRITYSEWEQAGCAVDYASMSVNREISGVRQW